MNKEELIGKLQMVYVGDKNALNELIGYYDGLKEVIERLQQENKELKERHYLIQGGRGNCKTLVLMLQKENEKYKSILDEIKGIVEETNYLANKTEIVNRGNIELHGVIDRLCLILRKIETLDKATEQKR